MTNSLFIMMYNMNFSMRSSVNSDQFYKTYMKDYSKAFRNIETTSIMIVIPTTDTSVDCCSKYSINICRTQIQYNIGIRVNHSLNNLNSLKSERDVSTGILFASIKLTICYVDWNEHHTNTNKLTLAKYILLFLQSNMIISAYCNAISSNIVFMIMKNTGIQKYVLRYFMNMSFLNVNIGQYMAH